MTQRTLATCLLAAAFAVAAAPARANQDAVSFGSNIHVAPNAQVHDAVCFFCSVDAEGAVNGDIVVFFGNVHIATRANHDVVVFFGTVRAEDNSSIGNDLVNFFGSIRLGENVSVGKDLVAMFGSVHQANSVTIGNDRVIEPGFVFWGPLLIMIVVFIVAVRELRAYRRRQLLRGYPFPPHL